jgi:hypothetical protein
MCQLISGLFPPLVFLALEGGTDRLSENVIKELPLYTARYLRRAQISNDDLVMQVLI